MPRPLETPDDLSAALISLRACTEAREWAAGRTLAQAWAECERGDWMLWLAARAGVDRKLVVSAACACARAALVHVPAGETRPLRAIETAEAWARGEATIEQVRAAAYAAAAADDAAYAAAAADDAAYAAAYAAAYDAAYAAYAAAYDAAYDAAYAAYDAAYAAYDAAYAAAAADAAAYAAAYAADAADAAYDAYARTSALRESAGLVRALIAADVVASALSERS